MENYLMINDKKIVLTDEQVKQLTEELKKKKSPFERAKVNEYYYILNDVLEPCLVTELNDNTDTTYYNAANYCTDENLMKQRAMHEALDRLLWRFSCENGELENPWNKKSEHWIIMYDYAINKFQYICRISLNGHECCFPSKKVACRAIEEVVKPFMEEHPDFVW